MRIVFIGSSKFGLKCLKLLDDLKCIKIAGVVTAPAKFPISYRPEGVTNVLHADVSSFCGNRGIECAVLNSGMQDAGLLGKVRHWRPQAFVIAGWYHLVPKSWRDLAPAYGLHASLLPDYSGGAPLVWAIINGEKKTGITLFQLNGGVDSGPIAAQAQEPIFPSDTIASLYERIEERGLELLSRHIPELAVGSLKLQPQDESQRRVFPQRAPEDGRINWTLEADYIERFVRAQTRPYPGAFSTLRGEQLSIWAARCRRKKAGPKPGWVERAGECFLICTGKDQIELEAVTFRGREFKSGEMGEIFDTPGQQLGVE